MYTAILRRAISTYTIILRRVNRMKIFVFVYIRRWGGLVAQGIRGIHRSCFSTQNRNGVRSYCTCLSTRNRNGVRSYCTCLSTQNRNGTAGRIWREIVKDGRKYKKYVEYCKGKVFVWGQYMGAIDFYTVLTYNQFKIINNNCKQYFFYFSCNKNKILLEVHILS